MDEWFNVKNPSEQQLSKLGSDLDGIECPHCKSLNSLYVYVKRKYIWCSECLNYFDKIDFIKNTEE